MCSSFEERASERDRSVLLLARLRSPYRYKKTSYLAASISLDSASGSGG